MFPASLKSRLRMLETRKAALKAEQGPATAPQGEESPGSSPRSSTQEQVVVAEEVPTVQSSKCPQTSKYLIITVLEARNLVAKSFVTHSSDPFVKITLGSNTRKTRAIYKNCHPLWEQKLVFPIDGLSEVEPLLVELFDKDFNGREFLGQVVMTLGKALDIEADGSQRDSYWFVLSKKRSTDVVGGELCLGFEVAMLEPQQYTQLLADLEAQLNSEALASSLSSKALHIQLQGLNGLAASGLFGNTQGKPGQQSQQQLSLFIKYGRVMLEKQLAAPLANLMSEDEADNSAVCLTDGCEVVVNEEVLLPLAAAVRATPLVARRKDELLDIKLILKSQDTVIAKTQIPITSVPITGSTTGPSTSTPAEDTGAAGLTLPPKALTPPLTARSTHEAFVSREAEQVRISSHSMPGTPRGTMCENLPAASSPMTPASNSTATVDLPGSPLTRTKSEVPALPSAFDRRAGGLGGWAGSSSNLSGLNTTSSMASTQRSDTGSRVALEGSLDSVTAVSRGHQVHTPAGLHGRRVQGLAELHEGAAGRRKPLKAMFVPPREVRGGWVPVKTLEEGEEPRACEACGSSSSRAFCRIMESTVPMYGAVGVHLALAVVDKKVAAPEAGVAEAVAASTPELCDALSVDEEEEGEEASAATPLQLGPALEVVLQDVTLQGISAQRLFGLVVGADSELMRSHQAAHDLTEVKVGPWKQAAPGCGYQRSRDVSYTKKLNIPLPLAPDKCHVWEEHRLVSKAAGCWVLEQVCRNDAPKGDCFEAHVQICGVHVAPNCSRLRVSMQLNWHKNTWGKSMVQGGAESDAKRSYEDLVNLLRQHASSSPGAAGTAPQLTPGLLVAPVDAAAAGVSAPQAARSRWLQASSVDVVLRVALVLSVLLLAWAVLSAGRSISQELRNLAAVMKQCRPAAEGFSGSLVP